MQDEVASDKLLAFVFQAEGGIRYGTVTGVQTCALPVWAYDWSLSPACRATSSSRKPYPRGVGNGIRREIGRASCRERVGFRVVLVWLRKNDLSKIDDLYVGEETNNCCLPYNGQY